jgi:hypothetical protein
MTLIQTAKLNGVHPMAWLTDVLERIVSGGTKNHELHTLLPWTWTASRDPCQITGSIDAATDYGHRFSAGMQGVAATPLTEYLYLICSTA